MKIAYFKLYTTWRNVRILLGTALDQVAADAYVANVAGAYAEPVYINNSEV